MEKYQTNHISNDLHCLWNGNVRTILKLLRISRADFARMLGVSDNTVGMMFYRCGHTLTHMQFHATMWVLFLSIMEAEQGCQKRFDANTALAKELWKEIHSFYMEHGLN
ncbi:MAG: hypothetical protein U0I27_02930 [Christensenellales bacterium]|nr:hypothetical protein [Christensenellales bacterium]